MIPVDLSGGTSKIDSATIMVANDDYDVKISRWFLVDSVDGIQVNTSMMDVKNLKSASIEVPPGERLIVVRAILFASKTRIARVPVTLKAIVKARETYRVNGTVKENTYRVWLEESRTGVKVTPEVPYAPQFPNEPSPETSFLVELLIRGMAEGLIR
jgi:hypothetical protein